MPFTMLNFFLFMLFYSIVFQWNEEGEILFEVGWRENGKWRSGDKFVYHFCEKFYWEKNRINEAVPGGDYKI